MRFLSSLLLFCLSASGAWAITVPNFSFETPNIIYASSNVPTGWTKVENNPPQIGLFDNPAPSEDDHIDNVDGQQAVFIFAVQGLQLFQEIPTTYAIGVPLTLTLGVGAGGGGMSLGSILQLRLFYRDATNAKVYLGTRNVVFDATFATNDPPPINHLFDFSLSIPAALAGDPQVGKFIGIEFATPNGTGGYWDIDNVRLVPEPGSVALLLWGVLPLLARLRRTHA